MKVVIFLIMMLISVSSKDIDYKVIDSGDYSKVEDTKNLIITNENELYDLYLSHKVGIVFGDKRLDISLPKIDFEKNTLVAFFVGRKNSGGYGIDIENVTQDDKFCTIYYKLTYPLVNAPVIQSITSSYKFFVLDTKKEIKIIKQ